MISTEISKLAQKSTPQIEFKVWDKFRRHDVLKVLSGKNNIGIELGVAAGHYSKRMIRSGKFQRFYGVDLYEDHHNTNEYISALSMIGIQENYTLLRMSFDEAIGLFSDNFFDFIYFDGYAHTGEEGGKTFSDWYQKLKVGGMFAGDDYHDDWPLVKWAVNDMVKKLKCDLNITGATENTHLNRYPSWFFIKESDTNFSPDEKLLSLGLEMRRNTRKRINNNLTLSISQLEAILKEVKSKDPELSDRLRQLL